MSDVFRFACPACRAALTPLGNHALCCPIDHTIYHQEEGIWRFLIRQPEQTVQFMREYEAIRQAEGRGSSNPAYYRELPYQDRTGRFANDWKIRRRSYEALLRSVIAPLEQEAGRPLKVLDMGAGNGWLSNQLARRGHSAAAVDLQTNALDGLGAHIHYDAVFLPVQADFDRLPFLESQADLVIFNASFHYSTGYPITLAEALRVLHPEGRVVILDSPIYRDERSGAAMVQEREEQFRSRYGFASNALPNENFLTYSRLEGLGRAAGVHWRLVSTFYGLSWALRPLRAGLAGRREPAQFRIAVGSREPT